MKEFKVIVKFELSKIIPVELEEGERTASEAYEEAEKKAMDMIRKMTDEEYEEFTSSCESVTSVAALTMEDVVKFSIDDFDPYVLLPGEDAPYDEYDGESRRILEEIKQDMSKEEIADIIAKIFSHSFSADFTRERCMSPAADIYNYLQV